MVAARRRRASAKCSSQQIASQAPLAINRHEWRRFDLRSALVTTALGTGVLMGASLWPTNGAMAACIEYDPTGTPNTVFCDTAVTTVDSSIEGTVAVTSNIRHQVFGDVEADPDNVVVTITDQGIIDGFGLAVSSFEAGASITVDHQGAISVDDGNNPTFGGNAVFNLTTNGGDITYTGNGSVIDNDGGNAGLVIETNGGDIFMGTAGSPVTPNYQGTDALQTDSDAGDQHIFLDGGSLVVTHNLGNGILATSDSGDINLTLTGNTAITTTIAGPNSVFGLNAASNSGSIVISSDADIGSAGFEFSRGVSSFTSDGTIDVSLTGGTIMATTFGVNVQTFGANAGISIATDDGNLIDMLGGTGILAVQSADNGGVTVTVDGDIEGADVGVDASITDAANADSVVVSASGAIQALTGSSISATTAGTGNATVNLLDGATMQGGVLAQSTTGNAAIDAGNNVTVDGNSPGLWSITAGGDATVVVGNNALVTGSSGIVVDQTNPAGTGVATVVVGDNGVILDNDDDATDDYDGSGIFAGNQGTGLTSVTTGTGTSVTGDANGIFASQTNAANINDITITTDGPVTGSGTDAFTLAPYTDAFVAAALPTTGLGIGVSNEGTGDVLVNAGDTVTGSDTGIQVLAAGGGGIAVITNGAVEGTANTGILAETADGDIAITANADVTGGLRGIFADAGGTGNIAVTTGGSVEGTASIGILTTTNDGDMAIAANGDVIGGFAGIFADAGGTGSVAVTTGGTVEGTAGVGILTDTDDGDIAIAANGDVTGGTTGILADASGTGNILVTTGGTVEGTAVTGILTMTDDGDISIAAGGDVTGGNNGILADAGGTGNIAVTTGGTVAGTAGTGILTVTADGDISIAASADVTGGSNGILADAGGTGAVSVTTGGTVTGTAGTGILALTDDGSIAVTANGAVIGANQGIQANAGGTGSIVVTAGGSVEGTSATGILTTTDDGDITVSASADVTGGNTGILASAGGTGNIAVTTGGAVEGTAATGILTQTNDGDIAIAASGAVTGGVEGILAIAGGTGNIAVTTDGAVEGTAATGIRAVTSDGDIAIAANGAVDGGDDGIVANAGGTGQIAVTTGGPITGSARDGINTVAADGGTAIETNAAVSGGEDGIQATATGAGAIAVLANGPVSGTAGDGITTFASAGATAIETNAAVTGGDDGIDVISTGAGAISVEANGSVDGVAGDGIVTSATDGATGILANGTVTGGDDGIDATASGAGNINVTVAGGAQVTGAAGAGVSTQTGTGAAAIDNAGVIEGAFAAISGATSTVLDVVNQAGGLIQNLSADIADLAISVTGTGVADIDNDGTIRGRVSFDAGDDTFDNSGLWATSGTSDFGAGTDSVTNTGHFSAAEAAAVAEITHLANLETFTNASTGVIDMVDDNAPNVGDELTIDGLYTGAPGSIIQMDLALVSGDPQAGSDLLVLDPAHPATGTSDFLFNIVSTGVTATTADTDRVAFAGGQILAAPVTVVENRGTLTTSSGDDDIPLARSGLITYDLVSTANDYQVVSQFDAGLAGGLLLPIPATLATVAFTTQRTPNPITATCIDPDNKANAQGGWVRGLAGQFNTESAGEASVGGVTSDLESDNHTRFKTLQGGFDHVWCNLGSSASTFHLGVTVGQTWGDSVQQDPDPAAGIFGTDVEFDTFFVGPYAAFTRGNFAAQASLRYDYHSLELTNPTVGIDADGLDVDAEGISGAVSMTYDYALASLTLTPDIGVNVSNTEIDSFDIAGGTVVLDDLWSVMGHAGVTARTQPLGIADNLFVVPFASATLYHEFVENADGAFDIGGTVIESESNRVGTFGQLGIGANAVRLGDVVAGRPTLFGGARFDLQVGERIEGATATVFGRVQF